MAVTGQDGAALPFAVAYVLPEGVHSDAPVPANGVLVDQRDREFVPYVTVVQAGTAINFPNEDNIRHQVYSFSTAKQFELPLYEGNPHSPVLFDRPGRRQGQSMGRSPWLQAVHVDGGASLGEIKPVRIVKSLTNSLSGVAA